MSFLGIVVISLIILYKISVKAILSEERKEKKVYESILSNLMLYTRSRIDPASFL